MATLEAEVEKAHSHGHIDVPAPVPVNVNLNGLNGYSPQLPRYKKIFMGLSGAGKEGPSHIGALMLLDDVGLIPKTEDGIEIICKSSGAMVGGAYMLLKKRGYDKPAYQIRSIQEKNTDMYHLFGLWDILKQREGLVDPIRLGKFLDSVFGDAKFEDIPGLYVVVHNKTKQRDIVFGKVGKKYKIKDAIRASIAMPGMIEHWVYHGETITDELGCIIAEQGDKLVDGGSMRRSAVREVNKLWPYRGKNELAISVYIGKLPEEGNGAVLINGYNGHWWSRLRRFAGQANPKTRIKRKIGNDLDIKQDVTTTREWVDTKEDIYLEFGKGISAFERGHKRGVVWVTPYNGRVSVAEDGVPTTFVKTGYDSMRESLLTYFDAQRLINNIPRVISELYTKVYIASASLTNI